MLLVSENRLNVSFKPSLLSSLCPMQTEFQGSHPVHPSVPIPCKHNSFWTDATSKKIRVCKISREIMFLFMTVFFWHLTLSYSLNYSHFQESV